MSKLNPEAQALVRAGRHAFRPSNADRERALRALRAKLGDSVVFGGSVAPSSPTDDPGEYPGSLDRTGTA
jgi:hypothetical protein